mmetsp:Transcript_19555/g.66102  ORF Transcript_19555/g.66102 Transcript_19555/m.66102 type:complete len:221 (+) Transcript_19555:4208-4870(+)
MALLRHAQRRPRHGTGSAGARLPDVSPQVRARGALHVGAAQSASAGRRIAGGAAQRRENVPIAARRRRLVFKSRLGSDPVGPRRRRRIARRRFRGWESESGPTLPRRNPRVLTSPIRTIHSPVQRRLKVLRHAVLVPFGQCAAWGKSASLGGTMGSSTINGSTINGSFGRRRFALKRFGGRGPRRLGRGDAVGGGGGQVDGPVRRVRGSGGAETGTQGFG